MVGIASVEVALRSLSVEVRSNEGTIFDISLNFSMYRRRAS